MRGLLGVASAWALVALLPTVASGGATARLEGPPAPLSLGDRALLDPWLTTPYHGSPNGLAFGGDFELRFHYDRVFGDADPDWFGVSRLSGCGAARLGGRFGLVGETAYDRATGDLLVEQAVLDMQLGRASRAHAGILVLPLGPTNLYHEAPESPFADRSLVATELLGFPCSQIGVGIQGLRDRGKASRLVYEADLVTGYGGGLLTDSPNGTRLASGRNTYGDNAGAFAFSGRLAWHNASGGQIGLSAQTGAYRMKDPQGVPFGSARFTSVVEADLSRRIAGCDVDAEGAFVAVDVPPGLEEAFAQTQWGVSVTAERALFDPLIRAWKGSSLALAARFETVDFDRSIPGDSKQRVSATLNLRHQPWVVLRGGWYYEIRRDVFNNPTPAAGLLLTTACYF